MKKLEKQICHFSFHKNLTVYYNRVANEFSFITKKRRKHFSSFVDEFLSNNQLDMRSVNNHFVEIESLREHSNVLRCSLFLRDLKRSGSVGVSLP